MIVTTLIIVFFVGIIIIYYFMLYSETKDNIITSGELDAVSSAGQIDKYLSTGVDVIRLTGYTLDNMITEKRSHEEMLDYLENQSVAAANIMSGNATGIYAYIDGDYLDGVGWVPDADYVPTERPWYKDAIAGSGDVVVVEPYLDAQTGTIMITLAKTLCDGVSVVAADFSLEQLQKITENIVLVGGSDMQFILDEKHRVIAHSDKNEIDKNYRKEEGTLGHAISEQLTVTEGRFFSLNHGAKQYFVYSMPIENKWLCLSVIDTTLVFRRLALPLLLTIVVAALVIAILLFIMIRSDKKSALAEKMKKLADIQTIYAYYDQMTGLKNRRAYSEEFDRLSKELPKDCCVIIFDVNGLKSVNDSMGHEAGDELIIAAAKCIRAAFGEQGDIYRLGGDEFCLIMTDPENKIPGCLEKLDHAAAEYKGKYLNGFSVSYGTGLYKEGSDFGALLKEADKNMYENKNRYYMTSGRDRRSSPRS
ncbi:MAG: sensor domain-containing diguanylate cyclase [Ruminiclostridium sp.]|nr:sensor domain-containing diguanylate cyclase [Ruminiclostridium sp.]